MNNPLIKSENGRQVVGRQATVKRVTPRPIVLITPRAVFKIGGCCFAYQLTIACMNIIIRDVHIT